MHQPTHLIFDLDGTISDPSAGIRRSMNYALSAFGYPELADHDVSPHIGPPLDIVFRAITHSTSDECIRGLVASYREHYGEIGYSENVVYPGIPEALRRLRSLGVDLGVCTSKRVDFAEKILDMLHLREYFAFVSGGDVGTEKRSQLRHLLDIGATARDSTMIGDRAVDVTAARANGLRAVGVLWGHGSEAELVGACPDRILRLPEQLAELAGLSDRPGDVTTNTSC